MTRDSREKLAEEIETLVECFKANLLFNNKTFPTQSEAAAFGFEMGFDAALEKMKLTDEERETIHNIVSSNVTAPELYLVAIIDRLTSHGARK